MGDIPKRRDAVSQPIAGTKYVNEIADILAHLGLPLLGGERKPGGTLLGATFRVNLSVTGGSAGSKTTAVSFVYTATSLSGKQLGTSLAPEWPSRSENGRKLSAAAGLGYYDATGAFVLTMAYERDGIGGC